MKYIILGKNGMLGSYVYSYFKGKYDNVLGTDRSQLDISDNNLKTYDCLSKLIEENDIVINCIGTIPQKIQDLKTMVTINSIFPIILSIVCTQNKAKLICISTDCVFNGEEGEYTPETIPNATSNYGVSKILGENLIGKHKVLRTSIIGEDNIGYSLLGWLLKNNEKTVQGYTNHYWNGITCLQCAKEIEKFINSSEQFIQLYSKSENTQYDYSKYSLLKLIKDIYVLNTDIIPIEKNYVNKKLKGSLVKPTLEEQIKEQKNFKLIKG